MLTRAIVFKDYHSLCPILSTSLERSKYFELSPLFAWTIVLIAARQHSSDATLMERLEEPYQKLLSSTISEMPQRYHTVKALALLCTWPVVKQYIRLRANTDTQRTSNGLGLSEVEPTFMLAGILI